MFNSELLMWLDRKVDDFVFNINNRECLEDIRKLVYFLFEISRRIFMNVFLLWFG